MNIKKIIVGPLGTNCYIIYSDKEKKAIVIDPGGDAKRIINTLDELDLEVEHIINTHGHFDHVSANLEMYRKTKKKIMIHEKDHSLIDHPRLEAFSTDSKDGKSIYKFIKEGDVLEIDGQQVKIIETPGHSPGSITVGIENALFVGDLLFEGSVGRTDLYGGNFEQLRQSLAKLVLYDEDTNVYPGHGSKTTIGRELMQNPYLQEFERKK